MAEIVRFDDGHGATVQIETAESSPVMRDVAGGDVFRAAEQRFDVVVDKVRDISERISRRLSTLDASPNEVSVELGISVNGSADVFIAKAASEGSLKVKMTWWRGRRPVDDGDDDAADAPE
ncbi:hypothetical protein CDO52_12215 [Nocardiopsis gilva YIM 90087]|uniref:Trypsin-co-occurring domain-containing protein n=1 Tax=Nocardiopsis gilva YIM 90087 TaxID=1235441 RepID=A0A223S5P8_9ACTN|nr:CU044_2847 family protein [Nocardiopsis gilva]ASU83445.1 hypothetical protein CDO52_12215 [Nocardiopsis gilva YIM 90087]